jgi:hypothetical protein
MIAASFYCSSNAGCEADVLFLILKRRRENYHDW